MTASYYPLAYLKSLATICSSQADDLKIEENGFRVWLSRVKIEDGMPFDNAVTIEILTQDKWVEVSCFPAE